MAYYNPYYYAQNPYYQQNQSYSNAVKTMEWVEGEVGAKAFQMPQGWPPETPIALWDNSEKKIYLKSWNQMGMPNQMQELTYTIKEKTNPALLSENVSGHTQDTSNFATKEDLELIKQEIKNLANTIATNNGARGGSK